MTEFIDALKADLLDRRIRPLIAVALVALVAAIAYVVLSGGSSPATPSATVASVPASTSPSASALAVSQSTPETAVAETTDGTSTQHHGAAHDPFNPLPGTKTGTAAASTAATGSSTSSGSSNSSTGSTSAGSPSTGGSTPSTPAPSKPSTPSKPSKPAKPQTVYHVAILLGPVPAGSTAAQNTQLSPFENLKLLTPLPATTPTLLVFRGVTAGGKSATFTVVGETILHGEATCLPSATQCQEIDLKAGQSEQLEYLPASGPTVVYELRVVGITASKASSETVTGVLRHESKVGRELLRHEGLVAIPYLRYSSHMGVLVFAGHSAFGAHVHAHAAHHSHSR
jgi:hypothetical protein